MPGRPLLDGYQIDAREGYDVDADITCDIRPPSPTRLDQQYVSLLHTSRM
jgi:hypothetical protein